MICAKRDHAYEIIGAPCPECGHTNLLHPGKHNPALEECLLCRMVEVGDTGPRG